MDSPARSTSTRRQVLRAQTTPTQVSVRSSLRCSLTTEPRLRMSPPWPSQTPRRTPHQPMRPRPPTRRLVHPRARTIQWVRKALLRPLLLRPLILRPLRPLRPLLPLRPRPPTRRLVHLRTRTVQWVRKALLRPLLPPRPLLLLRPLLLCQCAIPRRW